jgi:maltose alpha-D-glucosyltransferase/alpha-amylase
VYGYEAVNVEAQSRDTSSLLHWTRRLLAVRRSTQVFGRGRITMLHPGNRKVLAYLRELGADSTEGAQAGETAEAVLCVANLSRSAQPVELDLARFKGRVPVEMGGHVAFPPVGELPYLLTLPGYGFFWFRLASDVAPPDWHAHRLPVEDLAVLVLFDGWNSLFRDRVVPWRIAMATKTLAQFEVEVLPRFLGRQRWFASEDQRPARARLADHAELKMGGREWLLTLLETPGTPTARRWFAPFGLAWEDGEEDRVRRLAPAAVAKVRMQARVGVLADASADEAFGRAVVQAMGKRLELRTAHGVLHFTPGADFAAIAGAEADAQPDGEGSAPTHAWPQGRHSTSQVGASLFLKLLRQVQPGINTELEMGRFLHEVAHFEHCVPVAGSLAHVASDGTLSTLGLLQAYVPNQGSAWSLTVEQLARRLDRARDASKPGMDDGVEAGFLAAARSLAECTADLHAALAQHPGDPAFDPEPITDVDVQRWVADTRTHAGTTLAWLQQHSGQLGAAHQALARQVAAAAPALERMAEDTIACPTGGLKTRIHGDYRLQKLLRAHDNFVIVDFEGDPSAPPQDRRLKQSPLRDLARMLRSFDQARAAALAIGAHAEADMACREAQAAIWEGAVREAFLIAYAAATVGHGAYDSLDQFEASRPLLRLFEVDIALQQMREELGDRGTPSPTSSAGLAALARLLQAN